jgi:aminopeptidase YwaD
MKRPSIFGICLALTAFGAPLLAAPQAESISEAEIRAHLDFLASDLLEGRDSGYRGGELAAAYLESQLSALGLKPLFDGYQMPFELRGAAGRAQVRLRLGGDGDEATDPALLEAIAASALGEFKAPLVTASADPAGKIVIAAGGDDSEKAEAAAKEFFDRGAAGVVFVTAKEKFEVRQRRDGRRRPNPQPKADAAKEAPAGGGYLSAADAWLATHSAGNALVFGGPVVRVARDLGGDLLAAVDRGSEVELAVTRDGVDASTNVIGWLEGSDPTLRDEYVVIGAHYDHIGFDDDGNIWNGADDNASGSVAVLEIAEAFATIAPPKRSVVFCFWGAEERGLVGSEAFVRGKRLAPEKVAAYVNLDMVGRNDADAIFGLQASKDLFDIAQRCGAVHGLDVTSGAEMFLNASDSGPFIAAKVPTLFFFSGLHDQYHTPADDPGTVDYAKITKVSRTAHDMMRELAESATRPRFNESTTSRPPENRRRLGIFPDDEATGEGVAIRAVTKDGVAAKAGIQNGDRIIKVGDTMVADMGVLRQALAAQAEGAPFPIEVLRGGEKIVCSAVFEKAEGAKAETKN